jgi:hypothetical protein
MTDIIFAFACLYNDGAEHLEGVDNGGDFGKPSPVFLAACRDSRHYRRHFGFRVWLFTHWLLVSALPT